MRIYRLGTARPSTKDLLDSAARLFEIADGDDYQLTDGPERLRLQSRSHLVELSLASGGIWAADQTQLFNPNLHPELPRVEDTLGLARDFVESRALLPKLEGPASWGGLVEAGTRLATLSDGQRAEVELDRQVVFPVTVDGLPVVGGGGDFTLVLGDGGQPIGFHGVWRELLDAFEVETISSEQSEEEYRKNFQGLSLKLESVTSFLAYYSAPVSENQEFLFPVHVMGGTARVGDQIIPLRKAMLPATEFGPKPDRVEPEPKRTARTKPSEEDRNEQLHARRNYMAQTGAENLLSLHASANPWEAGASWIGVSGGLSGSKKNAQGFIDQWRADGWNINFNWGDANAWESDWRRNDDTWVDAADFVFYTGHASMNGWTLASPDDGGLLFSEVGAAPSNPGDLWGQNDLEWVTIAACGPLQDDILSSGGGNVLNRWDGAFDGLHLLMGYGAITFDNESEGRQLAKYAREGQTLKDAWFRTAKEIQPATNGASAPDGPTVWVGLMWATKSGIDPINDHAWSHGSVSADPSSPTGLACMWTVC